MRVEFDALPRAVRERWVEAARDPAKYGGSAAGTNTLREVLANRLYWLLLIGGTIGAFFASYHVDFEMAPTATGVALACVGVCGLLLLSRPLRRRTWDEGYVFPGCIVFARGRQLEILPFEAMPPVPTEVSVKRHVSGLTLNKYARIDVSWWHQLVLSGTADEAIRRYNYGRHVYGRALAANDTAVLESMNPFYECVRTGRWKAERAESGGPRIGGLSTWPSRAITFVVVPAVAVAAVGAWHMKAAEARAAREAAYEESKYAWKTPIIASGASPAAEALLAELCSHQGTNFDVFAPALSKDTLRALDDSARADKALGPSEILGTDWAAFAFVEAVRPRFNAVFTGWDNDKKEGAGVGFGIPFSAPKEGEVITLTLEPTRSGDVVTVSANGGGASFGGGSRGFGGSPASQRGSGRCLPLAFRGVLTVDGVASASMRVPLDVPAMSSDAIARGVSLAVDKGNRNQPAHICYQVQIQHAFEEAGKAFVGAVFRGGATPSMSSM